MSNMKTDYILLTLISNISYQYFLNLKFFLNTNNNSKFGNDIHSIENKEKYKYMKKNREREKKKKLSKRNTENCQQKPSRLKSQRRDCDALEAIYNAQQTQTLLSHVPKP